MFPFVSSDCGRVCSNRNIRRGIDAIRPAFGITVKRISPRSAISFQHQIIPASSGTVVQHKRNALSLKLEYFDRMRGPHNMVLSANLRNGSARRAFIAGFAATLVLNIWPALADTCRFEPQGEGRVTEIIDARSLHLDDGREIRLVGIEPFPTAKKALTEMLIGREVNLRGTDDVPDRYGRQPALVFPANSAVSVQSLLLAQGEALVSAEIADKDCAAALMAAEAEARQARRGTWVVSSTIKNAEDVDEIRNGIGRFMVVEGKVLSVRQGGTTTYLNFGRSWTRGFAVAILRRTVPTLESGGIVLKSLENRRIRVRGWVEGITGPRIEVLRVGQIEVLGVN